MTSNRGSLWMRRTYQDCQGFKRSYRSKKANLDVEIAVDMMALVGSAIQQVSGDGDLPGVVNVIAALA